MSSVRPLSLSPLPGAQSHLSRPGPGLTWSDSRCGDLFDPRPPPPHLPPPSSTHPPPLRLRPRPLHQGWQRPLGQRLSPPEHMTYKAAPPLSSTSGAHYRGDSKSEGGVGSLRAVCVCVREREREHFLTLLLKHPPFFCLLSILSLFSFTLFSPLQLLLFTLLLRFLPLPLACSFPRQYSLSRCQCHMITNTLLMSGFGKNLAQKISEQNSLSEILHSC